MSIRRRYLIKKCIKGKKKGKYGKVSILAKIYFDAVFAIVLLLN